MDSWKSDRWTGILTANIPAAAAASGANLNVTEAVNPEVLSAGITSENVKCNYTREISGMRNFCGSIGGFGQNMAPSNCFSLDLAFQGLKSSFPNEQVQPKNDSFNKILLTKYVGLLQQFVSNAEKGGALNKASFTGSLLQSCCFASLKTFMQMVAGNVTVQKFSPILKILRDIQDLIKGVVKLLMVLISTLFWSETARE
ncbi:phosphatidylinositol 4-kinase alpha 1-like isoform X5 [Nymphaea colorata]|uniref:phosphatidylinositol 4-kinase alpha 1-like isoform X5 n=1 Tax=Nymphaea colorata TaxID=210225 RepID=UPI00129DA1CE|nr:phosphatidylinositol 4-kinase alpha 1-like isoform X5 [Nymphaea colorata]